MRRYKISREGRADIIYGIVAQLDVTGNGVTMTRVARAMGLSPSTYVTNLMWELYRTNSLTCKVSERRNGGIVRLWSVRRPGEVSDDNKIPF